MLRCASRKPVIDEAPAAGKDRRERVILFNLSGHGFPDISAFNGIKNSEKA